MKPVRVLLINPRSPESFWSFRWALEEILPAKRAMNPPLGLATIAALCPRHWVVSIVDENIDPVPLEPEVDIVGIGGMAVQYPRQRELLGYYRKRGYFVVAGGSYASLCPERYTAFADTVVTGEAEYIWPAFCREFEQGRPAPLYREAGTVDLSESPTPRFELLALERYTSASVQFSRGCPYRCEFCDIIVMFGRRPRTKRPEQIGEELDRLREAGVRNVFFVDDNLIGHRPKAKALLRYLAHYQRRHRFAFQFGTEASLNLAEDEELLELFRAANFAWVFIGVESPDEASLLETGKTQNTRRDMLGSLQRIYAVGIDVLGGFIVGFDNDTLDTFDAQERFISAAGIQVAMVGLLTALPRTPLYERLRREGRLLPDAAHGDNTGASTNIVPKRMSRSAMVQAYEDLYRRLVSDGGIATRIRNKARHLRRPIYGGGYSFPESVAIVGRLLARGVLPGGPGRWLRFLATLGTSPPRFWPLAISDWIAGLALRDYVDRRLRPNRQREWRMAQSALAFIKRRCAACLRQGTLEVTVTSTAPSTRLTVTLRGGVDRQFFTHAGRRLELLLRGTAVTLNLRIEAFAAGQRQQLDALLARLAGCGDRITIRVSDGLRPMLAIDSSVFHLVLEDT